MMEFSSRNEGKAVRPYLGSEHLEAQLQKSVYLHVDSASGKFEVEPKGVLSVSPSEMRVLGLALIFTDIQMLQNAAGSMVAALNDVDALIVAVAGPTNPMANIEVLRRFSLQDLPDKITLNLKGEMSASAILSNPNSSFSIEFALVHNKNVDGDNALKPRRLGALLAKSSFEMKPMGVDDLPLPKPMDKEMKISLGLVPKSWLFFRPTDSLLTAETFEDAFDFFVDKELLDGLQMANPESKGAVETLLVTSLLEAIAYEAKDSYAKLTEEELPLVPTSAVHRMFSNQVKVKEGVTIMEQIVDSPSKVVAEILADTSVLNGLIDSLEAGQDD